MKLKELKDNTEREKSFFFNVTCISYTAFIYYLQNS